jgi:hypothetical protein
LAWTPNDEQMAAIQENFNAINRTIFDATEGQFVLGTVSLVTGNNAPGAMVQVSAGACGGDPAATCTQDSECPGTQCQRGGGSAPPGGWGMVGQIEVGIGCLQNPICFTHQFIHFIGNTLDEHEGSLPADGEDNDGDMQIDECDEKPADRFCRRVGFPDELCVGNSCEESGGVCRQILCTEDTSSESLGCLMQFPLQHTGAELCTATNHDLGAMVGSEFGVGGQDTEQSTCRGTSCWEQLGIGWPSVVEVPTVPESGPSDPPPVEFPPETGITNRVVVVIDRSGSMATPFEDPSRMRRAVNAAQDFVGLLSNETEFALVSFASADGGDPPGEDSTKDFPVEDGLHIIGDDRTAAQMAAEALFPRAAGFTNIGAGLREALGIFEESGITLNSSIVLLTDGLNNRPSPGFEADLDAAIDDLLPRPDRPGLPVHVTCIGQGRDEDQCAEIATRTGGDFVDSLTEENLYGAFVEFVAAVEGSGIAKTEEGISIAQAGTEAGTEAADIDVVIEPGAQQARFVISWTDPTNDLDLELFRPDGAPVSFDSRVRGTQGEFYRIDTPDVGTWKMRVTGAAVVGPEQFSARVLVDNPGVSFDAAVTRSVISWPDGFLINAYPSIGRGVEGCDVTATVQKPDRTSEEVALQDEGTTGDGDARDGLYAILFKNFTAGSGIYTFLVRVRCEQGVAQTIYPYDLESEEFPFTPAVPTFERTLRFSGMVTGVPADLPPVAAICRDVRVECAGPTDPIPLNGACSFDPEELPLTYHWSSPTGTFADDSLKKPTGFFPIGFNEVKLVVTDAQGQISAPDFGLVVVADGAAPVIHGVTATPDYLWSPDHGMVPVTLTVDVVDACEGATACEITSVENNGDGQGDGNTDPDWEITGPLTLNLRAERAGGGYGRVYTVEVTCGDTSINESRASVTISVPHDQGM